MDYDFDAEIALLNKTKNINDITKIFAIYYDLYYSIIGHISVYGDDVIKEYQEFLTKTMTMVIKMSESRSDRVSCESLLGNFLYYISNSPLDIFKPLASMGDVYKDNLNNYIVNSDFIDNIDKTELNFVSKCIIIILFKDYFYEMSKIICDIYGNLDTINFRRDIYNKLAFTIGDMVKDDITYDEYIDRLKVNARSILFNINRDKEFDFLSSNNNLITELFNSFNEEEINVFKIWLLNGIAGFNKKEFELLDDDNGMSRKEYKKLSSQISRKITKWQFNTFYGRVKSLIK